MKNDLNKLRIIKEEIKTALLYKDYDKAMEVIEKLEDFIDNNKGNCIFCDFFNNPPPQIYPGTVPNSESLEIRVTVKTPEGKKKNIIDRISILDNPKSSPLLDQKDKYTIAKNKAVSVVVPQNGNGKFTK